MSRYNLIDEPWIPVRDLARNRKGLGIRDTLANAEYLAAIEDPSPLVTAALHRFLLAVLYRALQGPCGIDEAKKLFRAGLPKGKIRRYLERWRGRFWLFDDEFPFGQISNLEPKAWRRWTALAAEHNADNAKVLFDHININASGTIPLAAAARWLFAAQTFAVSTGKSELSHTGTAPSAGALMVIPLGKTLADTLLFCLVPQNIDVLENDLPFWEREPESLARLKSGFERPAAGIVDLYTWQSRSIRLKDDDPDGISELAFASGVGYEDSGLTDPLLAYATVDAKDRISGVKVKKRISVHLKERGLWRNFDSLLPDDTRRAPRVIDNSIALTEGNTHRFPDAVMVLGQKYNPPRPNILFWRMERFSFSRVIAGNRHIRSDIHSYLKEAEGAGRAIYTACADYAQSLLSRGNRKPEKEDIGNFIEQMPSLPHYWSTLEVKFHEMLRGYTRDKNPDNIRRDWLVELRNALSNAWKLHQCSIAGDDGWGIRALVRAERVIRRKIAGINAKIQSLKEAP